MQVDLVEYFLSKAELLYARGEVSEAMEAANTALGIKSVSSERRVALKLFVARALSALSQFEESNVVYRELIDEDTYLPPVILGILHNNLQLSKDEKSEKNINLMHAYLGFVRA